MSKDILPSSGVRLLATRFRSPWFYWYTGHELIAITSFALSAFTVFGMLTINVADLTVMYALIVLFLDVNGFFLILLYWFVVRDYIPEVPTDLFGYLKFLPKSVNLVVEDFLHFREKIDLVVQQQLVIMVFVSLFLNRISAFFIAKLFRYDFDQN